MHNQPHPEVVINGGSCVKSNSTLLFPSHSLQDELQRLANLILESLELAVDTDAAARHAASAARPGMQSEQETQQEAVSRPSGVTVRQFAQLMRVWPV